MPKEYRSNKSYKNRLSKWIDGVLPYNLAIEYIPEAKIGLVDYHLETPLQKQRNFPHTIYIL